MNEIDVSAKMNKYVFMPIAGVALLAILYWITGSDWILIFLAPLALAILYSSLTSMAMFGAASFLAGHAAKKPSAAGKEATTVGTTIRCELFKKQTPSGLLRKICCML